MNLITSFVRRPVTTVMMVMVFVVLGLVAYTKMPVDMMPEMEYPLVQIVMVYEGAGPEELESQVVKKIEDEVSNISDIKRIKSQIYEGYAWTLIEFEMGEDVDIKALDVKDKVEQIKRDLPEGADDPVVSKFDPLSMPVIKVALISDRLNGRDLYELADKKLKDYFGRVSGVAKVDLYGGAKRQINIRARLDKMDQYGITIHTLIKAVKQESLDIPAGNIEMDLHEVGIRFKGEARTVEEIADLTFYAPRHGIIKISDVARVEDGSQDIESIVRFKGRPAILMDIYKRSDGNTIKVSDRVQKVLEKLAPSLPEGTRMFIAEDSAKHSRDAVKNAIRNIVLGIILCALMLYLFLRDIRITFVAAVVIPTSIISAFFLMGFVNFTINVVTLLALGISIGTLMANAIVVLENIENHVSRGESPAEASVTGTREIAVVVMASAGTNIVVFAPISFMEGMVGVFFMPFGITVIFATLFSLIASFSLTPMLSGLLFKKKKERKQNTFFKILHTPLLLIERFVNYLQKAYIDTLQPLLRHPFITTLCTLLIFISSFFLLKYVGSDYFPISDNSLIRIKAQLPKGATAASAARVISDIETVVKEIPELKDYTSIAGGESAGLDEVTVNVRLVTIENRNRSDKDIMFSINPALATVPNAEIFSVRRVMGASRGDIEIDIFGPDHTRLAEIAHEIRQIAMDTGNFRTVFNKNRAPKDEIHFFPDDYRRADYQIPNALIGTTLRYSVEGEKSGVLRIGGEEYDIEVRLDDQFRNSVEDLKSYKVSTPKGPVPISLLGTLKPAKGLSSLQRKEKVRTISLLCYIAEKSLSENTAILTEKFKAITFPPGYGYKFTGDAEDQEEAGKSILFAFVLAVILTYMLLAAILNSFSHPITILVTVPLAMVGVFLTLFLFGITFNMMSMMAIVMLVGIVVNNAILIIDYALQLVKTETGSVVDCVRQACRARFRAILMTNLAILAGIAPQVSGGSGAEFMIPLAATTMGGIAVSTLFTLFAIPALFIIMEKMNQAFGRGVKRLFG